MVKRKRSKCHGNSCKRNKSRLSLAILFQKQSQIEKQKIVVKCERHLLNTLEKLRKTAFSCENSRFSMVRVGRLELPASCSQSKRATNCATPGYTIKPHYIISFWGDFVKVFNCGQISGQTTPEAELEDNPNLQTLALQGFQAF